MLQRLAVLVMVVMVAACGGSPVAPVPAASGPPKLRLGDSVVPRHYRLDLSVDPARETFSGIVDIDVQVAAPTATVWLYATDLTVGKVTVGGRAARAVLTPGDTDHLGLAIDAPIGPGPAVLHIEYTGKLDGNETRGLFRERSGGDWYQFSHFESTDARRAFPCFDEPSWKTPFQVTVRVPRELMAVGNDPVESETALGDTKIVRFAETKPLPTYLIDLAVGPFAVADAGKARSGTPLRIVTPRGRAVEGTYAAQISAPILNLLEDYFGTPYPFAKLDQISVPKTVSFGAMEDAGLIPYVEAWLLGKPENDSFARQRKLVEVMAHELAHMWFGDLVTLGWWNDVWLNESFASWMGGKIVVAYAPTWGEDVEAVMNRSRGLGSDTLTSARAIRQPIASGQDIDDAFDPISYEKGAAVLAMFESWVGEPKFQRGVRKYLADHAYGTGSTEDFLAAISSAAGRDVAKPFKSFIDQAGAPLVSARLTCAAGKKPVVSLTQRRLLLAGATADERLWQVPVCLRYDGGRSCTMLSSRTAEVELEGSCPTWVLPNAGAVGYYRTVLEGDLWRDLVEHHEKLSEPEIQVFLDDASALANAGVVPTADVLAMLPAFAPASSHFRADVAENVIADVRNELVPQSLWPRLAKLTNQLFSTRAHELGFESKPGDDFAARRLRRILVGAVARIGGDAKLQAEARRLAMRWLDDRNAVEVDLARTVVGLAARTGDQAFHDRLLGELAKTENLRERDILWYGLGNFNDARLLGESLLLVLDPKHDVRETERILAPAAYAAETREQVQAFIRDHYDEIATRLPAPDRAGLMVMSSDRCDEASLAAFKTFFAERSKTVESGPRTFDHLVERIQGCIALKKAQGPGLEAYLSR